MQDDGDISREITASDMADALIRSCGWRLAFKKAQAHVALCYETDREEDAVFWAAVRNIIGNMTGSERNISEIVN